MRCWIGIDLGSTTTKAVVLDEAGDVLGRGITNSRSNYEVACAIARAEAQNDVRFTLCARALPDLGLEETERAGLLDALERAFRFAQHEAQLENLSAHFAEETPHVEDLFPGKELVPVVEEISAALRAEAGGQFAPGAERKSDFFRDLVASEYHRHAKRRACPERRPFEALMAVFDKSILKAESRQVDLDFEHGAGRAIARALEETGLAESPVAPKLRDALRASFTTDVEEVDAVGTGYGRARLPFERRQIRSEILCHGLGAHMMYPDTRTVLDIGGQDTKGIQVDENGIVENFQMNDRCAAGCGRYLGYIADEMNMGLHELGPMAMKSTRSVRINSTCTVFAGAELRDRLALGEKREDILAGLHRAIILRAMSIISRSGGITDQFTFTGGVAKNEAAVRELKKLVEENYGKVTINIDPDSIYTGALGAAAFARRAVEDGSIGDQP